MRGLEVVICYLFCETRYSMLNCDIKSPCRGSIQISTVPFDVLFFATLRASAALLLHHFNQPQQLHHFNQPTNAIRKHTMTPSFPASTEIISSLFNVFLCLAHKKNLNCTDRCSFPSSYPFTNHLSSLNRHEKNHGCR